MASKGKPYRTVLIDGYEVLIGKGALENDQLSLEVAQPGDVWLHVAGGTPGSHVVIRNPEQRDVPHGVLRQGAELAAWYSKARGRNAVEVHHCDAANVRKRRGAPAGQVEIHGYRSITVTPSAHTKDIE